MKRFIFLLFVSITVSLFFTGCTSNASFSVFQETSPMTQTHVSRVEKVSASDILMRNSSEENCLCENEWGKAMCYTGDTPEYSEVGVTVTGLVRGDEAVRILKNAGYKTSEISGPLNEDEEWVVLKYKVYCPEDFPVNDYGFFYTLINVRADYYSGIYKHSGFGTDISNYDAGDNYSAEYIYNGEVGEGLVAFSVGKDAEEIQIRFGSDPNFSDGNDEGFAYFKVK